MNRPRDESDSGLQKASPVRPIRSRFMRTVAKLAILPVFCFSALAHANGTAASANDTTARPAPQSILPGANCTDIDPVALYGGHEWNFQIRREGSPVGMHKLQFHTGKDGIQVIAESMINISFLGFSAYKFDYRSESLWQNNRLMKLAVAVDDDGDKTSLKARYDSTRNTLVATGPDGKFSLPAGIFPTNHWHCGVLGQTQLLNTITGRPNKINIRNMGIEKIVAGNGGKARMDATHIQYDGELLTDAWYDADGRWVRLAFKARDGSQIVYRCLTCTQITKAPR